MTLLRPLLVCDKHHSIKVIIFSIAEHSSERIGLKNLGEFGPIKGARVLRM